MAQAPLAVTVDGADELARTLRRVQGSTRDLSAAHRRIGREAAEMVRTAPGKTRQQSAAIRALIGRGSQRAAEVGIRNLSAVPFGMVAFMGAGRRTGWAATARALGAPTRRQQHLAWVGSTWDIEAGDGPYVFRDVFRDAVNRERIRSEYEDEIGRLLEKVGL